MDLTGEADDDPQKVGTPAADLLAGMDAALRRRVRADRSRAHRQRPRRSTSRMVESMTRFMTPRLVPYLGSGERAAPLAARKDSVIAIYQVFDTADEPMTLGLRQRRDLAALLGRGGAGPTWRRTPACDERRPARGAAEHRRGHPGDLCKTRRATMARTCSRAASVPAGPINRADEVTQDPALLARGLFYAMRDGERASRRWDSASTFDGNRGLSSQPTAAARRRTASACCATARLERRIERDRRACAF